MKLFDLHCDTPYKIKADKTELYDNDLHISLKKAKKYENYGQFAAICASIKRDDASAYERFWPTSELFFSEIEKNKDIATLCLTGADVEKAWKEDKAAFILAVEDARIVQGDMNKLDLLYKQGVRILTLMWANMTIIGGSHNTENGLTDFGKELVRHCFEIGIVPDISHASAASADDTFALAEEYGRPFIASHSCAYSLYSHSRNLRDRHIDAIIKQKGLIGMSLCNSHLVAGGSKAADVVRHIEYYLSRGAGDVLSLGCDLDGTDLPEGFSDMRDLTKIIEPLQKDGVSDEQIEKFFWKNAYEFAVKNIGYGTNQQAK